MRVDLEPNAPITRHANPGVESGFVVEGGTELEVEGLGTLTLTPATATRRRRARHTAATMAW